MTAKYLPVRTYIHDCFKNFPWASKRQFETIWQYVDHLLAGRGFGRQALLRTGLTEMTDRMIQYHLCRLAYYLHCFKQTQQRHFTKIDRRLIHQLAFDDVGNSRAGRQVFASSFYYNHAQSSVDWGQVLVDTAMVTKRVIDVDYRPYLPQPYLDRVQRPQTEFCTKNKMAQELFSIHLERLIQQGVPLSKIWASFDCWYASEQLTTRVRQSGAKLLQGLKKNTYCNLFGQLKRLDEVFTPTDPWHYRTKRHSGKKVWFQAKILNLNRHGRCKVFAIQRGQDPRIRYYATTDLKCSIERLLPRLRTHWQVETMHHDLKQYFSFRGCFSGKKILNQLHWQVCYLLYWLFRQYQWHQKQQGVLITIPQLIALYQYQYDENRAKVCFSSPTRRVRSKKALLGGLC